MSFKCELLIGNSMKLLKFELFKTDAHICPYSLHISLFLQNRVCLYRFEVSTLDEFRQELSFFQAKIILQENKFSKNVYTYI